MMNSESFDIFTADLTALAKATGQITCPSDIQLFYKKKFTITFETKVNGLTFSGRCQCFCDQDLRRVHFNTIKQQLM